MKSGKYDELMDKFYAGTASTEEINLLQSKKLIDDLDDLYIEAINSEREQKMDWKFEDFMKEVPATKDVTVPVYRIWIKRMLSAAAIVAALLTAYIFWPQQNKQMEIANVEVINKSVDINQLADGTAPMDTVKYVEPVEKRIKTQPKENSNYAVKNIRKGTSKSINLTAKENVSEKKSDEDFFVMVNGKVITNEADAIAITRESLSMVSRNLTSTVDELRPLSQIKIKL